MFTAARWRALRWFRDHVVDVNAVMGRKMPSVRMRNLMMREGQVVRDEVGAFGHGRFVLTARGEELLLLRERRRQRKREGAVS
jgi:hypothetical protein